jgi:hypothetical protein
MLDVETYLNHKAKEVYTYTPFSLINSGEVMSLILLEWNN